MYSSWLYVYGADPTLLEKGKGRPNQGEKGFQTICPHSHDLIVQNNGGFNPWNPPLYPPLTALGKLLPCL